MAYMDPTRNDQTTMAPPLLNTQPSQLQHPLHALLAPLGPPPPDLPQNAMGMSPKAPDMSGMSPQPTVHREETPQEKYGDRLNTRLMSDIQKDKNPYGSANNHPGFMGKFLHGLNVATGGVNRRQWEENDLGARLENLASKESQEGLQGAQTEAAKAEMPLRQAEERRAETQAEIAAPVKMGDELAASLGHPEWANEEISPTMRAGLMKQAGINETRENTNETTNQTKKEVAQTGATSRENVAKTAAQSREEVARINGSMRKTLESMKEASGVGKGANGPTTTTRAMAEMATTVLPRMAAISAEVDRLANEVGPAVGRWNELMVNKGGADHPEFAHLDTDLDLLASAIVRTHFGARGGQQYRAELRKQFGEAQSPEDLKQRIAAAEDWIQGYADAGIPQDGNAPSKGNSPQRPRGVPANAQYITDPKTGKKGWAW